MDPSTLDSFSRVLGEPLILLRTDGRIMAASTLAAKLLGRSRIDLEGALLHSFIDDSDEALHDHLRMARRSSAPAPGSVRVPGVEGDPVILRIDTARISSSGDENALLMRLRPREQTVIEFTELRARIDALAAEVHQRRRAEKLIDSQKRALENILSGRPLAQTFDNLLSSLEDISPSGMSASILLLDDDGKHLLHLSAPALPSDYNKAIDGIEIGPSAGSCGTAAFRNEPVIVSDIANDPLWTPWRDLALSHGLHACWSTPIPSRTGGVIGTFALYSRTPRSPTADDRELIDLITRTAAIAIESRRADDQTREALSREKRARIEAENADRLKGEFLATVSHELRTPLTSILGWTSLLRSGPSARELDEGLSTIESSARAQSQLVNDLLDVSRISVGQMKLERVPVDLVSVVRSAVATVRPVAASRHVDIEVTLPESMRLVMGDPQRLHQVVWNLLSNAIKFSPPDKPVRVSLEERDTHAVISVADQGKGIDSQFLPRLFTRFSQEESALTRIQGGLGLGLSIVKDLVDLHGGTVQVESVPGKGARFDVALPLADSSVTKVPDAAGIIELDGSELRDVRVLLVEDDDATREFLVTLMKRAGALITFGRTVEEGLTQYGLSEPQVLLCDIGLPGATGLDLIRSIRSRAEDHLVVAIALSAYLKEDQGSEALAAGFDHFQPKPIEAELLISRIRAALGVG